MSCNLSKAELDLLYYLVSGRCLSEKASISFKAIEGNLRCKMDVEDVISKLLNKGYVVCKKKKNVHYWAIAGPSIKVLRSHGYDVPLGNVHKL